MDRTPGKLGKLAAVRPHGIDDLAYYTVGHLAPPPPEVASPVIAAWGMMDNDRFGCCTISGAGHLIQAANVEVHGLDVVPDDDQIQKQYFAITGGADSGAVEVDVLRTWFNQGLFGSNKIAAFAPVRVGNPLNIHSAVALFGSCYIGVSLPGSAMQQFSQGKPWAITPHDQIEGGHCVTIVGYDATYLYAVTWGQLQPITYPWFAKYCDEAWAVIPQSFAEAGHNAGIIDIPHLRSDLLLLSST